jgi:hypothetical protein
MFWVFYLFLSVLIFLSYFLEQVSCFFMRPTTECNHLTYNLLCSEGSKAQLDWHGVLTNFLHRMALNLDLPNLCLPSTWDYRHDSPCPALKITQIRRLTRSSHQGHLTPTSYLPMTDALMIEVNPQHMLHFSSSRYEKFPLYIFIITQIKIFPLS